MKRLIRDYLILIGISGAIIALDQWSKAMVRSNLALGETWMPIAWLEPFARIVHWTNTGAAFGLFQQGSLIFTILAFVVSAFIIYFFPRVPPRDWVLRLALCLQLGGAVGNLIDRLVVGEVLDFISLGSFPVFNVADSSITIGTAVLLLGMWLKERKTKPKGGENDLKRDMEADGRSNE